MKANETGFCYETNLLGNMSVCHRSAETCKAHNESQSNREKIVLSLSFQISLVFQIDICLIIT